MRNIIALLALSLLLATPCVSDASYIIKLKNGREFVTSRYWEEGGQIKFYSHGGVIGIDKNLIGKIEESDRPVQYREENAKRPEPTAKTKPEVEPDPFAKEPKKTSTPKEALRKDDPFVKEFNLLEKRFSQASSMTSEELLKFSKDLSAFKKKVVSSRLAHKYTSQLAEVYTMGDKIESLLKSKGQ